jgi:hypothetical protein
VCGLLGAAQGVEGREPYIVATSPCPGSPTGRMNTVASMITATADPRMAAALDMVGALVMAMGMDEEDEVDDQT